MKLWSNVQAQVEYLKERLAKEHKSHDAAWAKYYKASVRARHDKSFKAQQSFAVWSDAVARSQERLGAVLSDLGHAEREVAYRAEQLAKQRKWAAEVAERNIARGWASA